MNPNHDAEQNGSKIILNPSISRRIDNPFLTPKITFLTTNQCNLRCKYCYNYSRKNIPSTTLNPELARSLLACYVENQEEQQIHYHHTQVTFLGGEPTLNAPAIFAILDSFKNFTNRSFLPLLATNGVISEDLIQRLIDARMFFQFSFDGLNNGCRLSATGEDYNYIVMKNIERVAATNLPIALRSTITNYNIDQMLDIVEFGAKFNVDAITFSAVYIQGRAVEEKLDYLDANKYLINYEKALVRCFELGIMPHTDEFFRFISSGEKVEFAPMFVLPDGSISATSCYLSRLEKNAETAIIGKYDLTRGLTLDQPKINMMQQYFVQNLRNRCQNCECYQYCRGRNANYVFLMTRKNAEGFDENICTITRGLYKLAEKYQKNFSALLYGDNLET